MFFVNIGFETAALPALEPGFVPLAQYFRSVQELAKQPYAIAIGREDGHVSVYRTNIIGTPQMIETDRYYLERLLKVLLWSRGGNRVYLCGDATLGMLVRSAYMEGGIREFDITFMGDVYGEEFEIEICDYNECPAENEPPLAAKTSAAGCRIGLDAGATNIKVCAVRDGQALFTQEFPWNPTPEQDPSYHTGHLAAALKEAAAHLPQVDSIGISSAGIFIGGQCRAASLFRGIDRQKHPGVVESLFQTAAEAACPGVPLTVVNDGDAAVLAAAGTTTPCKGGTLGLSMGTSLGAGYVTAGGQLSSRLNELAFVPFDASPMSAVDEWSGDTGCGVQFFSGTGVVRLAEAAGLLNNDGTPVSNVADVQALADAGNDTAQSVYRSLGACLGHALGLYTLFYDIDRVVLFGGAIRGTSGETLRQTAAQVLEMDYPKCNLLLQVVDADDRTFGQCQAAALLH